MDVSVVPSFRGGRMYSSNAIKSNFRFSGLIENLLDSLLILPVVNFINILLAHFLYESASCSFFYLHENRENLPKRLLYEKCACKMLIKLTPDNIHYTGSAENRQNFNRPLKKLSKCIGKKCSMLA